LFGYFRRLRAGLEYWVRQHKKDPYVDKRNILAANKSGVIFDIGAHIGETTAAYAKYFPKSMIYSFEPFEASYNKLRLRFKDNPMVKTFQMAISNKPSVMDFYSFAASEANSLLPASSQAEMWADGAGSMALKDTIKVEATTIDKFCKSQNIDHIMILKMDMQGGELLAIKGAEEMLAKHGIDLIYLELLFVPLYEGQTEYYQICEILSNFGYNLFNMYNPRYESNGRIKWCDGLFIGTEIN